MKWGGASLYFHQFFLTWNFNVKNTSVVQVDGIQLVVVLFIEKKVDIILRIIDLPAIHILVKTMGDLNIIQPGSMEIQPSSGTNIARSCCMNVRGARVGVHDAFLLRGMSERRAIRRMKSV